MRVLVALGLLSAFGLASCRCGDAGPGAADDAGVDAAAAAASAENPASGDGDDDGHPDDDEEQDAGAGAEDDSASFEASTRFRDAAPGVDRDERAPVDPACVAEKGKELSFAAAVVDERCAIDLPRAKKLRARLERAGGVRSGLRQEASLAAKGRITVRLVNGGNAAVTLPLSFHQRLPAFSVLAEDDRHSVFELAPPALELGDPGPGHRTHLARIRLEPGGVATTTVTVDPTITKALFCRAAEAGACALPALPKGQRYVLHIGELLTDVEVGDPARVAWDLP